MRAVSKYSHLFADSGQLDRYISTGISNANYYNPFVLVPLETSVVLSMYPATQEVFFSFEIGHMLFSMVPRTDDNPIEGLRRYGFSLEVFDLNVPSASLMKIMHLSHLTNSNNTQCHFLIYLTVLTHSSYRNAYNKLH